MSLNSCANANKYRWAKMGLLLGLFLVLAPSCKKDKEEENKSKFMDGTIAFTLNQYYTTGTTISLEATGINGPTEDSLKYYWKISGHADTLFGKKVSWTFSNEPGTFDITGGAKAEGYYTSAITKTVVVISPDFNEAIEGLSLTGVSRFTDSRDDKVYIIRRWGNREWFAQNLSWAGAGKVYKNEESLRFLFGGLYNWEEARTACPPGWRLPNQADWEALASLQKTGTQFFDDWVGLAPHYCADAKLNGEKMWLYHPYNPKTNGQGWNALPTGCLTLTQSGDQFKGLKDYGFWWADVERNATQAYYRYMQYDTDRFSYEGAHKQHFYASVRCVRNAQ